MLQVFVQNLLHLSDPRDNLSLIRNWEGRR